MIAKLFFLHTNKEKLPGLSLLILFQIPLKVEITAYDYIKE